MLPSGTPDNTGVHGDCFPLRTTRWQRFVKYNLSHIYARSVTLKEFLILCSSSLWLTLVNADEKSVYTASNCFPSAIEPQASLKKHVWDWSCTNVWAGIRADWWATRDGNAPADSHKQPFPALLNRVVEGRRVDNFPDFSYLPFCAQVLRWPVSTAPETRPARPISGTISPWGRLIFEHILLGCEHWGRRDHMLYAYLGQEGGAQPCPAESQSGSSEAHWVLGHLASCQPAGLKTFCQSTCWNNPLVQSRSCAFFPHIQG